MEFGVEMFTVFHGQAHIVGWVQQSASVAIEFDGGATVPVPLAPDGDVFRFDLTTPGNSRATLVIDDERYPEIGALALRNDPYPSVFSRFWTSLPSSGSVLEIGSRARSGISRRGMTPAG